MHCPLCSAPMSTTRQDGVDLDVCSGCGATWFDAQELSLALHRPDDLEASLRAIAGSRNRCRQCGSDTTDIDGMQTHCGLPVRPRCPRCQAVLSWVDSQPADLDVCFSCGGILADADAMARLTELVPPTAPIPPAPMFVFNASVMSQLVVRAARTQRFGVLGW